MAKLVVVALVLISIFCLMDTPKASPPACKRGLELPSQKPKVVLVHGFTGGSFCWYKVRYILELLGYNVTAVDLKAAGADLTDVSTIETFEQYNEPLDRFMASLPETEKVVVVGHSAGGVSVTKTLHDHSHKVLAAVYVAATMIKEGYLTCEHLQIGVPGFSKSKCNAGCPKLPNPSCFEKSLLAQFAAIPLKDLTEDISLQKSAARPGPYRALLTANFLAALQKGSGIMDVPRVYVKTLFDQTLAPDQQAAMIQNWPPCEVIEINNDHDVPSAKSQLLAAIIVNATMYSKEQHAPQI